MSLINQMLKDIDKRQGVPSSAFPDVSDFKPSMPRARAASPARLLVWGGVLLVAGGAAGYGVYQWRLGGAAASKPPVVAAAQPAAAPPEAPVVTAITVDDKSRVEAPAASASESKKGAASAAAPVPASKMLAAPAPTPSTTVAAAAPAPATAPAPAPTVAAVAPVPAAATAAARSASKPATAAARPASKPAPAAAIAATPASKPATATATAAARVPQASPKPALVSAPGVVSRVVSAEQRADNAYREALALTRQGRAAESQRLLRQALADHAAHQDARLLLAQQLMDEGQRAQAKTLLTEGLAFKPQTAQIYLALAQAQLLSKEADAAVGTLERGMPLAADNAPYQALMATALQQQSRHAEAVQYYVQALRQEPDTPHWLLGLGVSLQAQGNKQGAAEAYERALYLGLPATLAQFAREKLSQLGR